MSLACLTCQAVQRTHSDLTSCSLSPEEEQRCGVTWCWSKKNPRQQPRAEEANTVTVSTRVAPAPSSCNSNTNTNTNHGHVSPRLTRCHAVRRDIIRDWNFEDFAEAGFA